MIKVELEDEVAFWRGATVEVLRGGTLVVTQAGHAGVVAAYGPGHWLSAVHEEDGA